MFVGIPNPNILMPLEKMTIQKENSIEKIHVLYNPQSYQLSRSVSYSEIATIAANALPVQFVHGSCEILKMQLFFDSLSAGAEVGGDVVDKLAFAANSLLPSKANKIDVREYTDKIYKLMEIDPELHVPPVLELEWSSLQFKGFLVSCTQNFVRFDENGTPVRATLDCEFQEYVDPSKLGLKISRQSPDITKCRTVHQGDSLWAISGEEYGEVGQWREIAKANGIVNPRGLCSGGVLVIPPLD